LKDRYRPFLCSLPAFNQRAAGGYNPTLLDFAPDEVCRSGGVAAAEVGSYPAISPLPCIFRQAEKYRAVYFLLRCLSRRLITFVITRRARALPGIMPCGARTFLHALIPQDERVAAVWFIANNFQSNHSS